MAPRKNTIKKVYGDGGARNTRHFLEEVDAAWQTQPCGANLEKAAKQQTQGAIQGLIDGAGGQIGQSGCFGAEPGSQGIANS